jgi:hypothetical protein
MDFKTAFNVTAKRAAIRKEIDSYEPQRAVVKVELTPRQRFERLWKGISDLAPHDNRADTIIEVDARGDNDIGASVSFGRIKAKSPEGDNRTINTEWSGFPEKGIEEAIGDPVVVSEAEIISSGDNPTPGLLGRLALLEEALVSAEDELCRQEPEAATVTTAS